MPNPISHFGINAEDVERAGRFYVNVFNWELVSWGPPEFYLIKTGKGIEGALQKRRDIAPAKPVYGFECTISVDDVDATADRTVASGGKILLDKSVIAGVGSVIYFEDPEGNIAAAMEYDSSVE
jgi:hypothetical protein